jgi:hypothetical protein
MRSFWRELVIVALCFFLVQLALGQRKIWDLAIGLGSHVTVLVLSSLVVLVAFLISKHREIQILLSVHRIPSESMRGAVSLFVHSRLEKLRDIVKELTDKDGLYFEPNELKTLVSSCFQANKNDFYIGTDSNVPSEFKKKYPTYLQEHFGSHSSRKPGQDVRFMFASEDELKADFAAHEFLVRDFVNAHVVHSVALLQVDQSVADEAASWHGFPAPDIGLFGVGFVAFFSASDKPPRCSVSLQTVDARRKELFDYLRALNQFGKEFKIENTVFSCVPRRQEDVEAVERTLRETLNV